MDQENILVNMFCLPSAGSSSSMYHSWNKYMPSGIKIIPLDYPGHGKKIRENLTHDPHQLAHQLCEEIKTFGNYPFILFGHSVGAAVMWRIENLLRTEDIYANLILLVVSGRPAPSYLKDMGKKSILNDDELINELKVYNNFPSEILNHPDALEFFIKIIKNDFMLNDNMLIDKIPLTQKPLLSIYGKDDPYIHHHTMMEEWDEYSSAWLGAHAVSGDHFYFLDHAILLDTLNIIYSHLLKILNTKINIR
ncbi:thioesterase II family protein [Acinetobacter sp. MB5]|uniref:thioesterase II family protein n=1 Tax=Acinetobacter sp. MB5 TaxID=2069438 RepID=UPI000DCF8892|nr:alpha/beta fold hydrolase [Acinetobacter sp. MB5]